MEERRHRRRHRAGERHPPRERVRLLHDLTNVNGTLFFPANDGTNGDELWKSDGTAAGTVMVKDIYPGSGGVVSRSLLTNVSGTLFFTANDGTTALSCGSRTARPPAPCWSRTSSPAAESYPGYLTNVGGTLFFAPTTAPTAMSCGSATARPPAPSWSRTSTPGSGARDPADLTNVSGTLFFGR